MKNLVTFCLFVCKWI